MTIIIFIIILAVLILVHELGHFLLAKRFGVRVDEFGLGFPPQLVGKKFGETIYSLNWIPFGGFVKIFGENPNEESLRGPDRARSLVRKPHWVQALVLVAGVSFNLIFAWFLISVGFVSGLPSSVEGLGANTRFSTPSHLVLTQILPASPAAEAGLKVGDELVYLRSAAGAGTPSADQLTPDLVKEFVRTRAGEELIVGYRRGQLFGERLPPVRSLKLKPAEGVVLGQAAIGIGMDRIAILKLPVHRALIEGAKLTAQLTYYTAVGLIGFVADAFRSRSGLANVTGPVGLASLVGDAASLGWIYLLNFTAFISINLAVINLVPFPALDGGRLLFLLIEKIKGSMIKPAIANAFNLVGFGLLLLLMAVVTYGDILKLLR